MARRLIRSSSTTGIELLDDDDDYILHFPNEYDPATREVGAREITIMATEAEAASGSTDDGFVKMARDLLREHDAQAITRS